jgi:L-iditol 2-dehydrogenase
LLYINGGYAEYVKMPERVVKQNLLKIPEGVSFPQAALVEPLACVVHGVVESNIKLGDWVVVNGAGPIGLFFVALVKLKGARPIATDVLPERLERARKLGAEALIDASSGDLVEKVKELTQDGRGTDVAIDATGVPEVWEKAIRMVRKGGLVNLFGGCAPGTKIEVDTALLHYSELTIKGVYHHTPHYVRQALEIISERKIDTSLFITEEVPLAKIAQALKLIINHQGVKSAVIP